MVEGDRKREEWRRKELEALAEDERGVCRWGSWDAGRRLGRCDAMEMTEIRPEDQTAR